MQFNTINTSSQFSDGFTLAKFKGIKEDTLKDGTKVFKIVFNLCANKAGAFVETAMHTNMIASVKDSNGALQEAIIKDLCGAVGVPYSSVIDIPCVGDPLGAFDKTVKIWMKKTVYSGGESLNMAWKDSHCIWPSDSQSASGTKKPGYGI